MYLRFLRLIHINDDYNFNALLVDLNKMNGKQYFQKIKTLYFYPRKKYCVNFDLKIGWAAFWAEFSQTLMITLLPAEKEIGAYGL
jgi:hypothetical protein